MKERKGKKKNWKIVLGLLFLMAILGGFLFFKYKSSFNKQDLAVKSVAIFEKVTKFLPIEKDLKKEIETIDQLVKEFTKNDDVSRRYLLLLQNSDELRPTGGFLGQYAVVKVKNGQVESFFLEDANLLDQRITAKVKPPLPLTSMMSIKKWKFRDSNWAPDFPTALEKIKYFYRLSGGNSDFDGVIAINSQVLNDVLKVTGPVTIPGAAWAGEYNSENAVLKLEEQVEKTYLLNPELDTQNRKWIMKKLADVILEKITTLNNVPKLADFTLEELRNKEITLNFKDEKLQQLVEEAHWGGKVNQDWAGDYLMLVDANLGALKSDHYIDRKINYSVDLTLEKPTATLEYTYTHKATYGDWRTSDYHSYLRMYVPQGSILVERKMVGYPTTQDEFGKTSFGFKVHTLINRQTTAFVRYELPESAREGDYKLLVQKQSGVGDVPLSIYVKTNKGEFRQETVMKRDVEFVIKEE